MTSRTAGQPRVRRGPELLVDTWSDIMCSFCYLGHTALDLALAQFPHRGRVRVRHHSFMLMPELPVGTRTSFDDLLVSRHGLPRSQAHAINAEVAARAATLGLDYRMDTAIVTNTRAAHRLVHHAAARGLQHRMLLRLFKAYFTDGLHVGDHQVLAGLAGEVGLDREEVLQVLASTSHDDSLDAALRRAQDLGVTAVPHFLFQGTYAVTGAQPVATLREALDTTWHDLQAQPAVVVR